MASEIRWALLVLNCVWNRYVTGLLFAVDVSGKNVSITLSFGLVSICTVSQKKI